MLKMKFLQIVKILIYHIKIFDTLINLNNNQTILHSKTFLHVISMARGIIFTRRFIKSSFVTYFKTSCNARAVYMFSRESARQRSQKSPIHIPANKFWQELASTLSKRSVEQVCVLKTTPGVDEKCRKPRRSL